MAENLEACGGYVTYSFLRQARGGPRKIQLAGKSDQYLVARRSRFTYAHGQWSALFCKLIQANSGYQSLVPLTELDVLNFPDFNSQMFFECTRDSAFCVVGVVSTTTESYIVLEYRL